MLGVMGRWAEVPIALTIGSLLLVSCQTVHTFSDIPPTEGSEAEECLIDFSKKIAGYTLSKGPLPADLDRARFFTILDAEYRDKECIHRVQRYPVKVEPKDDSYVLFLCDKQGRWVLYEDWGSTIDKVDRPYVRERTEVSCPLK